MIRAPRWVDRELRIHDLKILLDAATTASRVWFRLYQNLSSELAVARAERDNAREDVARLTAELAKYEGAIPS